MRTHVSEFESADNSQELDDTKPTHSHCKMGIPTEDEEMPQNHCKLLKSPSIFTTKVMQDPVHHSFISYSYVSSRRQN